MAQAQERIYRLVVDATKATRELKKISKSTNNIDKGFQKLQKAATRALAVFAAFRGVGEVVKAADQINLLEGSFEALTGSAIRASDMLERVYNTVTSTGASLADVSTTYQRLTVGLEELGSTNEQIQTIADTFIKLGRVSGTSMFDTNAALVQFSQGLASGKLQGDELRSIMERLPLITKLIQEEWNRVNEGIQITRGQVKQLGREGKLSAELISNALLNGAEETARQFAGLTFTLEQEINRFTTAGIQAMAALASATGLDEDVKESVSGLTAAINEFTKYSVDMLDALKLINDATKIFTLTFQVAALTIVTIAIPSIITALGLMGAAMTALVVANPLGAFLTLVGLGLLALVNVIRTYLPYFKFRLPEAFYEMKGAILDALGFDDAAKEAFEKSAGYAEDLGIALGAIAEGKDWRKVIELNKELKELENTLKEIVPTVQNIETPEWDKWIEELEKLAKKLNMAVDPTIAFNEAMVILKATQATGALTVEGYRVEKERLIEVLKNARRELLGLNEALNKVTVSAERVKTPIELMNEEFDAMAEKITRLHNPLIEFDEAMLLLDHLLRTGRLGIIAYNEEAERLALTLGELPEIEPPVIDIKPIKEVSALMADLSQAGNHFIEGFSTGLADSLLDATQSFSDFAKSVLEDLARMILRAIFFNSIMSGLEGTSFGNFLGVGVQSNGSQGQGVGLLATGENDSPIGVLRPPTYGFGSFAGATGYGNITVNNNSESNVEVKQNKNSNGQIDIDILIEQKVNQSISSGGLDRAMKSSYGVSRRGF